MLWTLLKSIAARVRGGASPASRAALAAIRQGEGYQQSGDRTRSRREFERALALVPDHPAALYGLGVLDVLDGDCDSASRRLRALLRDDPAHAEAWNVLGGVNKLQRRWGEAIACYRRATALEPQFAAALSNLGTCLRNSGREAEAMDHLLEAARLEPANLEIQLNAYLGMIDVGRIEEGERGLAHVLAVAPEHAEAHLVRGLRLLAARRYDEGWREYEWRSRAATWERRNAEYSFPWWRGEALAGRRLLIRAEQGLGDQIMFASCLSDLEGRGAEVMLECDPRLVPLFARSFTGCAICAQPEGTDWPMRGWVPDLQVNIGSLPYLLGRGDHEFPARMSYLTADPSKVRNWRERLAGLGAGLKVGLSWRGGTLHTRSMARSVALPELMPLLRAGAVHFVSVQYGDCTADLAGLDAAARAILHHWPEALDDYDETAALTGALDLVISVQTTVVHLAGALGTPAWVMVPSRPEWRYGREGETVPWYRSVRLFRQTTEGDWTPVMDRLTRELTARCAGPP